MKNLFSLVLAVFLVMSGAVFAQCNMAMNETKGTAAETKANVATASNTVGTKNFVGNKICPVTGETIAEGSQAQFEYQGKVYNFCCPMCIDTFKQDPEKYIKILQEKEKAAAEASAAAAQK